MYTYVDICVHVRVHVHTCIFIQALMCIYPQVHDLVVQLQEAETLTDPTRACKLCRLVEANALFLPCAHMVFCMDCAQEQTECAACEGAISRVKQVFNADY